MLRRFPTSVLLLVLAVPLSAQFDYSVSLDVPARTWTVEGQFPNPDGGDVDYWIARWTPGAYHLADFGRFVDDLRAFGDEGTELDVERVDDSHFVIRSAGAREIRVTYDGASISDGMLSHGAVIDVESNRIRDNYAYLTPVSLFGFVPARMDEPFTVRFDLPEGWKAATVLEKDEEGVYHAESYQRFEDSPFLFSPTQVTIETEAGGKPLSVTVFGKEGAELDEIVEGCERITDSAIALMGGAPYDRYHYLLGYVPESMGGSGLEHSFSTLILMNARSKPRDGFPVIAHEFFHLYCAERIHVQGIREADFTQPFETSTIWVNESMTEYMTQHVLFHAGFLDEAGLFAAIGPDARTEIMGEKLLSPEETSRRAVGWETMGDLMLFAQKMYHHGPRVIFGLDLEMRRQSQGERGVVDFLRHVMAEYDALGKGFPEDGVESILEHVSGGELDAFYAEYIASNGTPDFAELLPVIGCELTESGIRRLEDPSEQQAAALDDFFSIGP